MTLQPLSWQPDAGTRAFHRAVASRRRRPLNLGLIAAWVARLHARRREDLTAIGLEQPRVFIVSPLWRTDAPVRGGPFQVNLAVATQISQAWALACHVTMVLPAMLRLQRSLVATRVAEPSLARESVRSGARAVIDRLATRTSFIDRLVTRASFVAPPAGVNVPMPLAIGFASRAGVAEAAQPRRYGATAMALPDHPHLTPFVALERVFRVTIHRATTAATTAVHAWLRSLRTIYLERHVAASPTSPYPQTAHEIRQALATPGFATARSPVVERAHTQLSRLLTLVGRPHVMSSSRDSTRATIVETFSEAHVNRLQTLEQRLSASRTVRTSASAFTEATRLFARTHATEWRFDEPSMAMRQAPQAQGVDVTTRTVQHRVQQEELIKTVRRTVVEENERLARQAARHVPSPQQLADDVYGVLTRRLVVERERLGR